MLFCKLLVNKIWSVECSSNWLCQEIESAFDRPADQSTDSFEEPDGHSLNSSFASTFIRLVYDSA